MDIITEQLVDIAQEADLLKGHDAMRQAGFSEQQTRELTAAYMLADDPRDVAAAVDAKIADAELERFLEVLPRAARNAEIKTLADQYGVPFDRAAACVQAAEQHDEMMTSPSKNPFIRRRTR